MIVYRTKAQEFTRREHVSLQVTARPTGLDGSARIGWRINSSALTGNLENSTRTPRGGAAGTIHQLGPTAIDVLAA